MSQITTHVLDTAKGKPASGIRITLYRGENDAWTTLAQGVTNSDGRLADLLQKDERLSIGIYKMRFETKGYFDQHKIPTFYPFVEIVFDVQSSEHYHIPLLLTPFGYTTYRGS